MNNWFNHLYPYGNLHELNLDWILNTIKKLIETMENFINLNTIKYADPILWDITRQYEANTVVVDGRTGNAYISTRAVPSGVQLSRSEYWTQIYNYADELDKLREQIANNEGESTTATRPYSVTSLVFCNGELYRVIAPMIAGDTFVVGSNCVKTTVESELLRLREGYEQADTTLQDNIDDEADAREQADTTLRGNIDDEADAREQADTTLQGNIDDEADAREQADTQLQDSITKISVFELPINHGAVGDGFADDTQAIQETINAASLNGKTVLLNGNYAVSKIVIPSGVKITGAFTQANRENLIVSDCIEISYGQIPTSISNLYIKGTNGLDYLFKIYAESATITNCSINASAGAILNYGSLNKFIGNSITCNGDFAFKLDIGEHININTIITNNIIAGTGSLLTCTSNNPAIRPEGVLFANNNSMCSGGYCIHLEAAYHISILNNTLDQIGRHVLTFNPTQGIESVIFSDNYIGITDPNYFAIGGLLPQNSPIVHNFIISNNNFFGCSCLAYINGYYQSVVIDGNNFESSLSGYPGLYCENTAYLRVTNNRIFKTAPGATAVSLDGLNIGHLILTNNIFIGAKTVTNYDVNHLTDTGNLSV